MHGKVSEIKDQKGESEKDDAVTEREETEIHTQGESQKNDPYKKTDRGQKRIIETEDQREKTKDETSQPKRYRKSMLRKKSER